MFIEVKVIPSSGRQKFVVDKSGILKCFLKSVPEKGKANDELVKFLSKKLKISKDLIEITTGKLSRKKRLKIDLDMDYSDLLEIIV